MNWSHQLLEGAVDMMAEDDRRSVELLYIIGTSLRPLGELIARPWPWAVLALSITWVHATLDEPPPATPQNPTPAFQPGQLLPYVPPVVVRRRLAQYLWVRTVPVQPPTIICIVVGPHQ